MKLKCCILLLVFVVVYACSNKQEKKSRESQLKISKLKGVVVPEDSVLPPVVKVIDESTLQRTKLSKTTKSISQGYIFPAGAPNIVMVGEPNQITPGKDSIKRPFLFKSPGKVVQAGYPHVVIAKEPIVKDANHANFSFYKTLQGLKHNSIRCLLQDSKGNLWMGTYGEGISCYNGKTFVGFSEKDGFPNNYVFCITEDHKGNLWIGTEAGLCCYNGKTFVNYPIEEYLSNSVVFSIVEDNKGLIWIGTNGGGVASFDGTSFTAYTKKSGLINDNVWSIYEDKTGAMWFGTDAGASRFDGKTFYNYSPQNGICENAIWTIMEDKYGNLWFGSEGGGVSKFNGNVVDELATHEQKLGARIDKPVKSFTNYTEKQGLPSNFIFSITEDRLGNIWFGTYGGGASCFNGNRLAAADADAASNHDTLQNFVPTFVNYTEKEGLPSNVVRSIVQDKSGAMWFATYGGGLARFEGQRFTNFSKNEGLANNVVWGIGEDTTGNIWLGTFGGGVSVYDGNAKNSSQGGFVTYTEKDGLGNNFVLSIHKDSFGKIWIGTNGGGVTCYHQNTFTNYTEKNGLAGNMVSSILEDKEGNLWFGTTGGGVSRYNGNRIDASGSKEPKTFTNFTHKQGLANNFVSSIIQDKTGNIWFGTNGGGVSYYNGKSFMTFGKNQGLTNDYVLCLLEDNKGTIWFGTDGGGLYRFNGKQMVIFTDNDGLTNNTVLNLIQDEDGNLWIGTREGLNKITKQNLEKLSLAMSGSRNLDPEKEALFCKVGFNDGFIGYTCRKNAVFKDSHGKIWWGADYLTCYSPEGDVTDTTAPLINLTSIKLFGEDIQWSDFVSTTFDSLGHSLQSKAPHDTVLANGVVLRDIRVDSLSAWNKLPQNLSLPYNNNNVAFTFDAVHMQSRNHIKYQYRLLGLEENWNAITDQTNATYGNLPYGNYMFEVKAMNQSGVWSEPFQFAFEVRPPWWKTFWFVSLSVITLIVGSIVFIKLRERTFRIEKENLERIVSLRTAEVLSEKKIVEEKNTEITNSINYALRIQQALLPDTKQLSKVLPDWFIMFRPKDIVSGDFYYFRKISETSFHLAVADSTGHGVSGGFMSMLGMEMLDDAAQVENDPGEILSTLNKSIRTSLKHSENRDSLMDGFDIAFCTINVTNGDIKFSGALRPIWILRKDGKQLEEIKGSRLSIGAGTGDEKYYETHQLHLSKGDSFYLFTDGYIDQFNTLDRRLTSKRFKEYLLSIKDKPMQEQGRYLNNYIDQWRGPKKQTDDMLIIGIKF